MTKCFVFFNLTDLERKTISLEMNDKFVLASLSTCEKYLKDVVANHLADLEYSLPDHVVDGLLSNIKSNLEDK